MIVEAYITPGHSLSSLIPCIIVDFAIVYHHATLQLIMPCTIAHAMQAPAVLVILVHCSRIARVTQIALILDMPHIALATLLTLCGLEFGQMYMQGYRATIDRKGWVGHAKGLQVGIGCMRHGRLAPG